MDATSTGSAHGGAELRAIVFGDCALDRWPPDDDTDGEPWRSFVRARAAARAGKAEEAEALWRQIASTPALESRHVLQAWHYLRAAGVAPPEDVAAMVCGAVAEVAVPDGHDLLAAYADGSVRYLNFSGAAIVVDHRVPTVDALARHLLDIATPLAAAVGPWEGPLPDLPQGHSRLTMLTPAGPRFGQGPDAQLRADPGAAAFFDAATQLLVAVVAVVPPT